MAVGDAGGGGAGVGGVGGAGGLGGAGGGSGGRGGCARVHSADDVGIIYSEPDPLALDDGEGEGEGLLVGHDC